MRNTVGDSTLAKLNTLDLAQLVLSLLSRDPVNRVAALGIVDKAEVLAGLLDRDHVHEPGGEGGIGADLAVDLDEALHEDGLGLTGIERVLQSVTDEDDQGQRVAELVRTRGSLGRIGTCYSVKSVDILFHIHIQFQSVKSANSSATLGATYRRACRAASARAR